MLPAAKIQFETGDRLGNNVILEKIDDSATHVAYSGIEPAINRHVAIKIFKGEYSNDPQKRLQFKEQALRVVELRHKHICPVYAIATENDLYYISGAYVQGYTLQDWLNDGRTFDEEQALWFMSQVIAGFDYASDFNILHLNFRPISVKVDWDGVVILLSMGMTQCHNLLTGSERYDCLSSPEYVAPEQISGQPVDIRTDMYSLGAVLFHLMTGHLPFEAPTSDAICRAHLQDPFPAERAADAGVPLPWVELMGCLMEKKPENRFQNYQTLSEALIKLA